MKGLGKYRILHCVKYNSRAERDHETWIVEEWSKSLLFGLEWRVHKEPYYDDTEVIRFKDIKLANEYVERLLNGNPRDIETKTVVREIE